MARTCADSLRAVSEAQADWVKTIAMAKGLPRNVAMPPPVVDHGDDGEDDEDPAPVAELARTSGIEAALTMVAPYIPELMDSWRTKKGHPQARHRNLANPMVHLARIQAQLTPSERQLLVLLLQDEDSEAITKDLASRSVDDAVAAIRRGVVGSHVNDASPSPTRNAAPRPEPSLMPKLTAIAALLEPAERARLMKLGPRLMASPDAIELMNTLAPKTPEVAAEWVRNHIDEIEARFGS